ncbi:DUF2782 domain-containing protein [Coralloluteibacterium thermophilus]|uniref:DUF2782 domain-containing protein n=1 Tax=Coralloluteibacterium thermophilum TaxID=2707049 RepID=A0ABV9NEA0_9GAMM
MRALLIPLLAVAPAVLAQAPLPEPLPPPSIDDPGVRAQPVEIDDPTLRLPPEPGAATPAPAPARAGAEGEGRITGGPARANDPRNPPEDLTVQVRTLDNGDVVEEYRNGGRLTMVRVTPTRGVSYTLLDTNGDGYLDESDGRAPVSPVFYTLYEWR